MPTRCSTNTAAPKRSRRTGCGKTSADGRDVVAVTIALSRGIHEVWLPLADVQIEVDGERRPVVAVENLLTGERHPVEWGGLRLRIDPDRDPALLFQCLA